MTEHTTDGADNPRERAIREGRGMMGQGLTTSRLGAAQDHDGEMGSQHDDGSWRSHGDEESAADQKTGWRGALRRLLRR